MANINFSPTILRNATVYGLSPRMRFDTVLNNLVGLAWTSRKIIIKSDGSPWRPLIHVLDVCKGINCILNSPIKCIHNKIYNLGDTNENYQIRELANYISEVIPNCESVIESSVKDNRSYRVSFGKINSELNFKCDINIIDGIDELVKLFDDIKLSDESFFSRDFTRIKQIEYLIKTNQINDYFYWRKQ